MTILKDILLGTLIVGVGFCSYQSPEAPTNLTLAGEIGSTLDLPNTKSICLEQSREVDNSWPVGVAATNWNENGKNLFTTELAVKCDGVVLVTSSNATEWWGSTEFYPRDIVNVQLSINTPLSHHSAVICHELGHVLGLPHSQASSSCMVPGANNPKPSTGDLTTVRQEPWIAAVAGNKMNGVK